MNASAMNAVEAIRKVQSEAKLKAKPDAVVHVTMAAGDYHRQGDVYITRLKEKPRDVEKMAFVAQLAPGNTQGSRHIIASSNGVTMFRRINPTPLDGPILISKAPFTIEHPEHGHVTLPAGIYTVNYQRQYALELKRVAD